MGRPAALRHAGGRRRRGAGATSLPLRVDALGAVQQPDDAEHGSAACVERGGAVVSAAEPTDTILREIAETAERRADHTDRAARQS